jgi:hypothetical protein
MRIFRDALFNGRYIDYRAVGMQKREPTNMQF